MSRVCAWCRETEGVRLYATGARCPAHTPAAIAGRPEPGEGTYCPPRICWDGTCAWAGAPVPTTPSHTLIDDAHVVSGKRSATFNELRAARLNTRKGQPTS